MCLFLLNIMVMSALSKKRAFHQGRDWKICCIYLGSAWQSENLHGMASSGLEGVRCVFVSLECNTLTARYCFSKATKTWVNVYNLKCPNQVDEIEIHSEFPTSP